MGGGLDLALACHRRIAAPNAIFGHRGAALGLITGWGGTQRLPRLIGKARAVEIFVAAEKVGAAQALGIGLIDRIADRSDCGGGSMIRSHSLTIAIRTTLHCAVPPGWYTVVSPRLRPSWLTGMKHWPVNTSTAGSVLTTKVDPTSARFEANMRFLADLMSQVTK